jgi:acyl carrier protein
MAAELARAAGAPVVEELAHPLVQRRIHESASETVFSSTFATATHWLLDEHRIAEGDALIPGTGFVEIARAALASRPEPRAIELRDVFLMHPFVVPDDAERELRVVLERDGGDFVMLSRRAANEDAQWIEHVRGTAAYVEADSPVKRSIEDLRDRCAARTETFDGPPRPPHLRFGPRWGCLQEVRYGEAEALATLELPGTFATDLETMDAHPAVLDLATGCAHALIAGYDASEDFYVPMSYARILLRGPLPRRLHSHLRYRRDASGDQDYAIFDVTLLDPDGVECGVIEEFMLKRVSGGDRLVGAAEAEPSSLVMFDDPAARAAAERNPLFENLKDAIRPDEAPAIFDALLAHRLTGHVAVLPHDLEAWIERLVVPAEPPGGPARAEDPALVADLEESAAAVLGCEGVADAVVTAHFDRPGERRLLAHIVWEPDHHGTVSELRKALRRALPSDLVPQNFVELDALPRDRDGDVDRDALEDPYGLSDDYVAPRTETEKGVAKIWQEILGVDRVGLHDNFFDIGGHSLLAMRVIVRMEKKLGARLNNAIMVLQTLEQVAAEIDKRTGRGEGEAPAADDRAGHATAAADSDAKPDQQGLSGRFLRAIKRGVSQR